MQAYIEGGLGSRTFVQAGCALCLSDLVWCVTSCKLHSNLGPPGLYVQVLGDNFAPAPADARRRHWVWIAAMSELAIFRAAEDQSQSVGLYSRSGLIFQSVPFITEPAVACVVGPLFNGSLPRNRIHAPLRPRPAPAKLGAPSHSLVQPCPSSIFKLKLLQNQNRR